MLEFLTMPKNLAEITIPTSKPDGSLTPDTLTLREFAEFADALSDLVDSVIDSVRQEGEPEPYVGFKEIHNRDVNYVLRAERRIAGVFDNMIDALKKKELEELDPAIAVGAIELHAVSKRHGWTWGIEHKRKKVAVPATEKLALGRTTFRYPTTMRGTIIRTGGDTARVRFRLMNGRAYSSVVGRDFAQQLKLYTDYMLTGEAEADADTLQIIKFKVRDAELVEEGDLDTILRELAETALPEFISTDTAKFFAA